MTGERRKGQDEKFCTDCGEIILARAEICPKCGCRQLPAAPTEMVGSVGDGQSYRKCFQCNHTGTMKTWLRNYNLPQFIALLGFLFWLVPGLVFIAWAWGKYKCPHCGAVGKNAPAHIR